MEANILLTFLDRAGGGLLRCDDLLFCAAAGYGQVMRMIAGTIAGLYLRLRFLILLVTSRVPVWQVQCSGRVRFAYDLFPNIHCERQLAAMSTPKPQQSPPSRRFDLRLIWAACMTILLTVQILRHIWALRLRWAIVEMLRTQESFWAMTRCFIGSAKALFRIRTQLRIHLRRGPRFARTITTCCLCMGQY